MVALQCRPERINPYDVSLTDRQERLPWWSQKRIQSASILIVGCGGLGSNQGKVHQQTGLGQLDFIDHGRVEDSNRNRQLFTANDVGRPKAHQLLKNLQPFATFRTRLRGYYMTFEEWAMDGRRPRYDTIVCGADNFRTMVAVAGYGITTVTTVVFVNVSRDGEACRIFIQRPRPTAPCFACYMPQALEQGVDDKTCIPSPAIADILQVAIGMSARATAGEILGVPIGEYNCRNWTFSGIDLKQTIRKRPHCPLCGD